MDKVSTDEQTYLQNKEKDVRMHRRWSGGGSLRCLSQKYDYLEQEHGFREDRDEKKSVYLGLRIPWVYIGRLQSSSRLSALNGLLCPDL